MTKWEIRKRIRETEKAIKEAERSGKTCEWISLREDLETLRFLLKR